MIISAINAIVPMYLLEFWMRPRGFGGQDWYFAAWHYIVYGRVIYWGIPLVGLTMQIMGFEFMLSSVAFYISILSIPMLSLIGGIGEGLIQVAIKSYSENDTITLDEIKQVEYYYLVAAVATIATTESVRGGALNHANKLVEENI